MDFDMDFELEETPQTSKMKLLDKLEPINDFEDLEDDSMNEDLEDDLEEDLEDDKKKEDEDEDDEGYF